MRAQISSFGKRVTQIAQFDSLVKDTAKTYNNALKTTLEVPRLDELSDLKRKLWIAFYNVYAEVGEVWADQMALIKALRALQLNPPDDASLEKWQYLSLLERSMYHYRPVF
ncbi:MAG: hypothetical protein HWE08_13455 [Alphaproteobacteria bacterium]|nr:hypothetical protein [Alphaproteobacteria bacterium]